MPAAGIAGLALLESGVQRRLSRAHLVIADRVRHVLKAVTSRVAKFYTMCYPSCSYHCHNYFSLSTILDAIMTTEDESDMPRAMPMLAVPAASLLAEFGSLLGEIGSLLDRVGKRLLTT